MRGVAPKKSERKRRRNRQLKPQEASRKVMTTSVVEALPSNANGRVEVSERVVTNAVAICSATTEQPGNELPTSNSRRARRRKLREARTTGDMDSVAPADPPTSACPVADCGEDAGRDPIATVGPDGAVTFTIAPQGPHFLQEYGELLQWLRDARAAVDLPTTAEDVHMTFTISVSRHGGPRLPSSCDTAVTDITSPTTADVTASELLPETPSAKKRRKRRRKLEDSRIADNMESPGTKIMKSQSQTKAGNNASSPSRSHGGCFTRMFYSLLHLFH